jgi:cytochrome c
MKNTSYLFNLFVLIIFASCAKSPENKGIASNIYETASIKEKSIEKDQIKSLEKNETDHTDKPSSIISNYDCYSCHKDDENLIGPSFKTIAEHNSKKTNASDYLADKIKKGSVGVFGQIPMQPHNFIPDNEIDQICEYILNLK